MQPGDVLTTAALAGVVAGGAGLGAGAGAGIRVLLGRLRRGVVLRPGIAETAGAAVTGIGVGIAGRTATLALALFAGLLMVALGAVDIVHHRLPDAITLVALPVAGVGVVLTSLLAPGSGSLASAAVSAAVLWAVFALVARVSPRSMGRGDVKLVPTLGLLLGYLSPAAVLFGLLIAFASGSCVALAGMAAGRLRLGSAIPLGPYLLFGCWLMLLVPTG